MSVDPTYPLYPIACIVSAALLFLVLTTNAVRGSWNIGVFSLCFWLFWEVLSLGVNAIVWRNDADVKAYVYCDIVSHLYVLCGVVRPAGTLIITRRLYKIASMQSIEAPTRRERIWDLVFDWTLCAGLPVLVAGVFYYIDQAARFEVVQGFGCTDALVGSGIDILLIWGWTLLLPAISVVVYCPMIIYTFYRQRRDTNRFLRSNNNSSVSRETFLRIFALGCLDIIFTLPFGIINVALIPHTLLPGHHYIFYHGWDAVHTDWEPVGFTYDQLGNFSQKFYWYVQQWTPPTLGFILFILLGLTSDARTTYSRGLVTLRRAYQRKDG